MKKRFLKLKIAMTNISRVIMSFLFVNVGYLFQNSVLAIKASDIVAEPTCYAAGPSAPGAINLKKVFIIAVPIVLVIAVVLFIIVKKKKSKKKKEEEVNKEKMTNQGEKDV